METELGLPLEEIAELSEQAYIYGFAPVEVAKKTFDQTNPTPNEPVYAPINELYIDTQLSTPDSALWVSPNVNVLYSSAHLDDLSDEPIVLFTPDIQDRYFSWEIMDAYTNAFDYIGTRATGGVEGTYALVGPDFTGTLPDGLHPIESPTDSVWLVGRHEVAPESQSDLDTAIELVQESILLPLDTYIDKIVDGNDPNYDNPIIKKPDNEIPALDTSGLNFFEVLNEWLTDNPPPSRDDPTLEQIAQIGVGPGFSTDFDSLPQLEQDALLAGIKAGEAILEEQTFTTGTLFNGWFYNLGPDFGNYGTDYLLRSLTARDGLGANINEEAIYPVRLFDRDFLPLNGEHKYTITFPADSLPVPINDQGFWSITMYDRETGRLVENPIDRYSIGSQNQLTFGEDGSLTIYIQRDNPGGDKEQNWLPAPQNSDPFYLLFRAYFPEEEMFKPFDDPTYKIPELVRVGSRANLLIEAEDLDLETYQVEDNSFASGGELISLGGASETTGNVSTEFTGPPGLYDIVVGYFDDNDGDALLRFKVNDLFVDNWSLDQDLDFNSPVAQTIARRSISGVELTTGDTLTIEGTGDFGDFARIDFLQFFPRDIFATDLESLTGDIVPEIAA